MSKYTGLFTFDKDTHKYIPITMANDIIDLDCEKSKGVNEIDVVLEAIDEYGNNHLFDDKYMDRLKILNIAENKLIAWKRLEDKGFHWLWVNSTPAGNSVDFYIRDFDKEATRDLEFIFERDNI